MTRERVKKNGSDAEDGTSETKKCEEPKDSAADAKKSDSADASMGENPKCDSPSGGWGDEDDDIDQIKAEKTFRNRHANLVSKLSTIVSRTGAEAILVIVSRTRHAYVYSTDGLAEIADDVEKQDKVRHSVDTVRSAVATERKTTASKRSGYVYKRSKLPVAS